MHINTDRGRVRKPYIIVENGKSSFTKELGQAREEGDRLRLPDKERSHRVPRRGGGGERSRGDGGGGHNRKDTHLEVDPTSIFGFTINTAPFAEHNQLARHLMFASYLKQAQGVYATNFNLRFESRAYILFYPQAPLVTTKAYESLKMSKHASGQNFVVALSTYYGYNMQDAIIFNKSAVDRGLGRSMFYKTYVDEERRYPGGQKDVFKLPPATTEGYLGEHAYSKLSEDGVIEPEMKVEEGDVADRKGRSA